MTKRTESFLIVSLTMVLMVLIGTVGVAAVNYKSAAQLGQEMESSIKATWEANEGSLQAYEAAILDAAGIQGASREELRDLVQGAILGRYGNQGANKVFKAINANNPNPSQDLYDLIRENVTAGSIELQEGQASLVQLKQEYENALADSWNGMWLSAAGYPKKDLSTYNVIRP